MCDCPFEPTSAVCIRRHSRADVAWDYQRSGGLACAPSLRRVAERPRIPEKPPPLDERCLRDLVDDALDLATVDVEFAGYRALAVACVVPGAHRMLQSSGFRQR